LLGQIVSEEGDLARRGLYQPQKHTNGGTFSSAILTQEPENVARLDLNGKPINGSARAKGLSEIVSLDGELSHWVIESLNH